MAEMGTDFSQANIASPAMSQECIFSGEEMVGLISQLLDSKLDKKFADFKRAPKQKELSTNSQIKMVFLRPQIFPAAKEFFACQVRSFQVWFCCQQR